jgi:hypothetical protein
MALWLETDSNANKDISSAVSVGVYTATGDVFVLPQILADQVAGSGDYVYYVTIQVAGAGTHYVMGPKTTQAAASGETGIAAQGGLIFMRNADVLTVYIDGLAGDTTTPDVTVRFAAIPLPSAAAGAAGGLPVLDANLVSAANVTYLKDTALTETSAGYLAAAFKKLFDVASPILTVASVNQTADVATLATTVGAAGAGLTALGDTRLANLDAAVSTRLAASSYAAAPSAADVADAVWDELLADHTDAGSAGAGLAAAGSAGDPWSTVLPGSYGASTAGQIIGDTLGGATGTVVYTEGATLDDLLEELADAHGDGSWEGSSAGSGTGSYTDTITDADSNPLDGVRVQLSTDSAGTNVVYEDYSDALGVFAMRPDPGTYYRWLDLAGYTFTQGVEVEVS